MAVISILDDNTINKIAAGEVVERPASVVKELVENAIDAGAGAVSIEIKGGGIDLIRVTDNGSGIEKDSIKTAFLRHATSKIRSAEDLMNITSLGFRGEALSSIAAVSQVELMTKTKDSVFGYRYVISGGREMSFDEAGVPDGTTIICKNLFYNVPARRKFLKSAVTEGNLINTLVERLILSHPFISFKYIVNGNLKLSSNGLGDIPSNVYTIFGRDCVRNLVDVEYSSENCTVSGYVGKPEIARGNRNYELFFVNDRLIKSPVISSAVEEAYKPYLMQHRYPFVILYFEIPSELLDVNIHPSKTEIRFIEDRSVYSIVFDTVTEGITRRELIPQAVVEKPEIPEPKTSPVVIPEPFEEKRFSEYKKQEITGSAIAEKEHKTVKQFEQETLFHEGFLSQESLPKHRIIGQVFDTYWIIEYEQKMYMIDQHAAHEKVLYERFSKQIKENAVTSQLISPAYIVTLSSTEETVLTQNLDAFSDIGFTIEHFGGREYAISAVPTELFRMSELDYFLSVLDELANDNKKAAPEQIKDRIATMACKAAIKGNMHMTFAEADSLITQLLELDNPYNCPHGRPTMISFSKTDLEKLFKRIV